MTVCLWTNTIQLFVFEELNIKIDRFLKGETDRHKAGANITLHEPMNLDIGLLKNQLLFYCLSLSSVWFILSKRSVILDLHCVNVSVLIKFSLKASVFTLIIISSP